MPVNQVSWSDIKNFLSKRPRTTKNPYFLLLKIHKKKKSQKSKFSLHKFLGNIVVQIQAKYQKDRIKSEGAYSIWKKLTTTTTPPPPTDDGRLGIGKAPLTMSAAELKNYVINVFMR